MMTPSANTSGAPLLSWPEQSEMQRLRSRRATLAARISLLPPRSFKRIALQAEAGEVTRRLLELENARPSPARDEEGQELKWFQK